MKKMLFCLSLLGFFSCSQSPNIENYLLPSTQIVLKADLSEVSPSVFWENIGKQIGQNGHEQTGVNFFAPVYLALQKPQDKQEQFAWLILELSDKESFEQFATQKAAPQYRIKSIKKDKFSYGINQKQDLVAWTDNLALIISPLNDKAVPNLEQFFDKIVQNQETITDTNFKEWLQQDAQLALWAKNLPQELPQENETLQKIWQNRWQMEYLQAFCSFEQGKVQISSKIFMPKTQIDSIHTIWAKDFVHQSLSLFDEQDIWAFVHWRYEPQTIKNLLDNQLSQRLLAPFLKITNMSEQDFLGLFQGDALAIWAGQENFTQSTTKYEFDEDFNLVPKTTTTQKQVPIFALSMPTTDSLKKGIDALQQTGFLTPQKDFFSFNLSENSQIRMKWQQNMLTLSNSPKIFEKTYTHNLSQWSEKYPVSAYFDVQKIMQNTPPKDPNKDFFKGIKNIYWYCPMPQEASLESHIEVNFLRNDQNSLTQILENLRKNTQTQQAN